MVSTIDGKTVSGGPEEPVADLGSENDHLIMRRIIASCDAVLSGAATVRAYAEWSPQNRMRIVLSRSGILPWSSGFFADGKALVATTKDRLFEREGVEVKAYGEDRFDPQALLSDLRQRGIERLLILGGSEVNALFLQEDVVDELFLTIAPKIRLGRGLQTYAGGEPLPKGGLLNFELAEAHRLGDEVFLRYRRPGA